jgi:ParB family chromosome partitioning protein
MATNSVVEIRVTCHTSEHCELDKLEPLQGALKKRSKKDLDQIETSILKFGIAFPFFYSEIDGHWYILDGHGRKQALLRMRERGIVLPQMPIVKVDAKSIEEAKQLLLRCESRYGLIDIEGFRQFIEGLEIEWGDLALPPEFLGGFDGKEAEGGELTAKEKQVKTLTIGEFRVELTDAEYQKLNEELVLYVNENVLPNGFFAKILGIGNEAGRGIFFLSHRIEKLKGADYNPRSITNDAIDDLIKSIQELGMCRPIIANMNNMTIIAGHQRMRALKSLGMDTAPVFFVRQISAENEARINQIHNAVEDDNRAMAVSVEPCDIAGFSNIRGIKAPKIKTTKQLNYISIIMLYGNIDSAIATMSGEVLKGKDYLLACKAMHIPARVYYIKDEKKQTALKFLYRDYGQFDYTGKNQNSFQQHLAQMNRLSKGKARVFYSQIYKWALEKRALNGKRALDFGAGKCAFAEKLSQKGFNITPIEFFRLDNGKIMTEWCNLQADKIAADIKQEGLYDVVICDSVLNSVVSKDIETDVINTCAVFLNNKGKLFISGRIFYDSLSQGDNKTIYELDKNGFTMNMRQGHWYGQHFHAKEDIKPLLERHGLLVDELIMTHATWKALCRKGKIDLEKCLQSVYNEFNLVYNDNGDSYQKGNAMKEALLCVYG